MKTISRKTWREILKEYKSKQNNDCLPPICYSSESFRNLWENEETKQIISRKAYSFLNENKGKFDKFFVGILFLFTIKVTEYVTIEERREIRLAFLNYCAK